MAHIPRVGEFAIAVRAALIAFPCQLCPGATEGEIEAFETRHGVVLTDELREAFRIFNGTELGDFGESITQFYSIGLLRSLRDLGDEDDLIFEPPLDDPDRYFVVADVMIRSHWLAFYLPAITSARAHLITISLHDRSRVCEWYRCADSFAQFLSAYLEDPGCIPFFEASGPS